MTAREKQILNSALNILKESLNPSRVILFGSRGKDIAGISSDFDFAVDCDGVNLEMKREIKESIEAISGLYKVDVVYLNEIEKDFKDIILKSGKVIYERGT